MRMAKNVCGVQLLPLADLLLKSASHAALLVSVDGVAQVRERTERQQVLKSNRCALCATKYASVQMYRCAALLKCENNIRLSVYLCILGGPLPADAPQILNHGCPEAMDHTGLLANIATSFV